MRTPEEEEKIRIYSERGYSKRLILLSIASQKYPETILSYVRHLKQFTN